MPTPSCTAATRRTPTAGPSRWLAGDRLVALLVVDRPRDLAQGRKRIGTAVDAARLADPGVPLKAV